MNHSRIDGTTCLVPSRRVHGQLADDVLNPHASPQNPPLTALLAPILDDILKLADYSRQLGDGGGVTVQYLC